MYTFLIPTLPASQFKNSFNEIVAYIYDNQDFTNSDSEKKIILVFFIFIYKIC